MQSETMSGSTAGLLPALKDVLRPAYYFVKGCWISFNVAVREPRDLRRADPKERDGIRTRSLLAPSTNSMRGSRLRRSAARA
jgi:hypothetical protein